jgi:hypothetical protein
MRRHCVFDLLRRIRMKFSQVAPKNQTHPNIKGRTANLFKVAASLFLAIVTSSAWCQAADVVFLHGDDRSSSKASYYGRSKLEVATSFYGVNLKVLDANSDDSGLIDVIAQRTTIAVAIDAKVLQRVDRKQLFKGLQREQGRKIPVLIFGVVPETDPTLLKVWSDGAVIGCQTLSKAGALSLDFGRVEGITQELSGVSFPLESRGSSALLLSKTKDIQTILQLRSDGEATPVFVESMVESQPVFMVAAGAPPENLDSSRPDDLPNAFATIAPQMLFIKYAAGRMGWHAPGHYANLTIDDPWLRNRYGFLDYAALLGEMEAHNFHTTIAFIPWNYDRSEPATAALIRSHPDKFSISVHGDNHDHKEFADINYKPLSVQIAALKESLARMEKFQELTGINYEPVFIFPHSIGSEQILENLKKLNFLATINANNVPEDKVRSTDLPFALRSVTLAYGDFPSVTRYPATMSVPSPVVRINEFLDNPILFYSHHDLFSKGIASFDKVADDVNNSEPSTSWSGLQNIVEHLYLLRETGHSDVDILAFSSRLHLHNALARNVIFHVERPENGAPPIKSFTVDGKAFPYEVGDGYVKADVNMGPGADRIVAIEYASDLDLPSITIDRTSVRQHLLRMASDFRDITLSQSSMGNAVVKLYYKDERLTTLLLAAGFVLIAAGAGFSFVAFRRLLVSAKTQVE